MGFTLLHSDLSLPTSFPSWLFMCGYRVISCKPGYFTDSSSVGRVRQCMFLKKSSYIHGRLMNEDLYDTGSAVVSLYRLFTNFLKFPGESPGLGGSIWKGGEVSLGSQDLLPPILHFSHFFQLKLFEITS